MLSKLISTINLINYIITQVYGVANFNTVQEDITYQPCILGNAPKRRVKPVNLYKELENYTVRKLFKYGVVILLYTYKLIG